MKLVIALIFVWLFSGFVSANDLKLSGDIDVMSNYVLFGNTLTNTSPSAQLYLKADYKNFWISEQVNTIKLEERRDFQLWTKVGVQETFKDLYVSLGYVRDTYFHLDDGNYIQLYLQNPLSKENKITLEAYTLYNLDKKRVDIQFVTLTKQFETEDNVIPASNSVMCHNLLYLGIAFENRHYTTIANKMLQHIIPNIDYPSAFSNWLIAYLKMSPKQNEIALIGENAIAESKKLSLEYNPNYMIFGAVEKSNIPFLKDKFIEDKTLIYICENKTCGLPAETFA
jgi:hypothetical protein